jgi:hypothetical protein
MLRAGTTVTALPDAEAPQEEGDADEYRCCCRSSNGSLQCRGCREPTPQPVAATAATAARTVRTAANAVAAAAFKQRFKELRRNGMSAADAMRKANGL